jgi:cytochrome c556
MGRTLRMGGGVAAAIAAALVIGGAASAQQDAEAKADQGAIKYRQSVMESIEGDMGAIANVLKYGLPFGGNLPLHADSLHAHAKLITAAYERKVTAGPTDAEPAIWEKPDEFAKSARTFVDETAKLAEVAKGGDAAALGVQVKATGKACGNCHDSFRKPKEESFKRKSGGGGE